MRICVKKNEGVTLPERGSLLAAGYDIVATSEPKIVGDSIPQSDGVRWNRIDYIEYETGLFIAPTVAMAHTLIHPRSSISKYNLVLANSIGLVDNDYRGMIVCRFKYIWQPDDFRFGEAQEGSGLPDMVGDPNMEKIYKKGDKIAQLVFEPTTHVDFSLVDELDVTQRGAGGFGSTDRIVSGPANFDEKPSDMANLYRKLNYVETPKKYEQKIKEAQENFKG